MEPGAGVPRHPGLILGVARFYYDPRGSVRGMLASQPGEPRLFAYAIIAAAIVLAGRLVDVSVTGEGNLMPRVLEQIGSTMFFVPLFYYGLAALGTMLAQTFGGEGGWRDGRAAFFWAALVSAPLVTASKLAPLLVAGGPESLSAVLGMIGPVAFGVATAYCFTEAFGFRRVWTVAVAIAVPVVLVVLGALLLRL